ncbi:prolyl oligopeptidase family serine peptidase [Nocardioides panacisoli]|uniref:alpha/beta hydrolase family protein n=1 Tax=Nocardioides panacisoli TaxID=627624 RepID=UPI001C6252E2|nr:alpha/beta fold hydrolase [Nocardioides panacisoli]QYJ04448.1 prolyl oligopeptidase family serine peptidase [Nocardioides panacisoli]
MRRTASAWAVLLLVLTACSGAAEDDAGAEQPSSSATESSASSPTTPAESASPSTTPSTSATPEEPPHPVSLPALAQQEYDGRGLRLGREVLRTADQVQYDVTYRSGDLRISGRLAVPTGSGPFPAIVLAHGYIDPAVYDIGQGMTREREWFAANGYVALHVDYRNHGGSDADPDAELQLRLGYTEDVINAVRALRRWDGPVADDQVAIGGRSMGGGVVYNALAVQPGLVDAAVVWAPVSSDTVDNFERWIRPSPDRSDLTRRIINRYGDPARPRNADFWDAVSPRTYFDQITEPVLIHHGTLDDSCPVRWSRTTHRAMQRAGVDSTLEIYEGEQHAFGPRFYDSMERTGRFLRRHLA